MHHGPIAISSILSLRWLAAGGWRLADSILLSRKSMDPIVGLRLSPLYVISGGAVGLRGLLAAWPLEF